jgi:nucleoside recognition membrane protein YjiH
VFHQKAMRRLITAAMTTAMTAPAAVTAPAALTAPAAVAAVMIHPAVAPVAPAAVTTVMASMVSVSMTGNVFSCPNYIGRAASRYIYDNLNKSRKTCSDGRPQIWRTEFEILWVIFRFHFFACNDVVINVIELTVLAA